MTKQFEGRIVLITGGGSGIGKVTAEAFAAEGAGVVICDLVAEGAKETEKSIVSAGGKCSFMQMDVTKGPEVQAMVARVEREVGRLDFAINSAGIDGVRARTAEYPEQTWAEEVNVNLSGVFLCMKYELQLMIRQGHGVIVNLGSVAALTGFVGHAAYTASKHGVI